MNQLGAVRRPALAAVCIAALMQLPASQAIAAALPLPVTAVVVRGTTTPLEVTLSWTSPTNTSYAGSRVVVVPGSTPTVDPADPAAIFTVMAAAPATTVAWSDGVAGQLYSASVFAYDASGTAFAAAATAPISLPGPIKHLGTDTAYGFLYAYYVQPPTADAGVLCQRADRVPTSPADATRCSFPGDRAASDSLTTVDGVSSFAVFSIDTATGIYGPGVSTGDGSLPPMTPNVSLGSAATTRLGVAWSHSTGEIGMGTLLTGGTVRWELLIAPGTRTPVGDPTARKLSILASAIPVDHDKYGDLRSTVLPGVVPDMPYTAAMRGFDAEGNASPWSSPATGATATLGTRLDQRGIDGRWRTSVIAGSTQSNNAALVVQPSGVTHVFNDRVVMRKAVGGVWSRVRLPARIFGNLTVAGSRSASGTIAFADRNCVYAKQRAGTWRNVGCLTVASNVAGQRGLGLKEVFALEVDRTGAVHVLYSGNQQGCACGSLHYATNRSGRWLVTRIRNLDDRATGEASHGSERGVADMTYDPVTDKVVVVIGNPAADGQYTVSVGTKAARATAFGPLSTRLVLAHTSAVVPQDVVSYGDRITIAARRADAFSGKAWATPVLLTGTSAATIGGMVAIPDSRADDENLTLTAQTRTRVLIGWNHHGFSANDQGVWTSWRTYDAHGRAVTSRASRRTRSAFDVLDGVGVDARGRVSVLYRRGLPS